MSRGLGITQQKILLLLLGGLALGLSKSPARQFRILKLIGKEWRSLNRQSLWRSIRALYLSKLVDVRYEKDGSVMLIVSEEGKRRALLYNIDDMKIRIPNHWNKKWHLVAFDIPEKKKRAREALREKLRQIGMREFQKSIFISPYQCDDEVYFLVEFYEVRPYVRKIVAERIDNELHFKQKFGLPL